MATSIYMGSVNEQSPGACVTDAGAVHDRGVSSQGQPPERSTTEHSGGVVVEVISMPPAGIARSPLGWTP